MFQHVTRLSEVFQMAKEQSFVARYSWKLVLPERPVKVHYVRDGESRIYLGQADIDPKRARLVEMMVKAGLIIETEERTQPTWEIPKDQMSRGFEARAAVCLLIEAAEAGGDQEAAPSAGDASYSPGEGLFTVRTPTRLGQKEHAARRRIVEEWLRAEGLEWSLTCATEHSDAVCRPINLAEPAAPEPGSVEASP